MSGYESIIVAASGPVGRLTLNRPDRLNALSFATMREIIDACATLSASEVRVVVVSGAGRAFSAGFDLADFADGGFVNAGHAERYEAAALGQRMAEALMAMRPVTVAALHGAVVGGGLVVAAACDLRVAARDATISIPEVDLGIALAWGAIPMLVAELGPALTRELVMTCRPLSADDALAAGFLNRVVDAGDLDEAAAELAEAVAARPRLPIEITKKHVNEVLRHDFARDDAADLLAALSDPEATESRARYLERWLRRSR